MAVSRRPRPRGGHHPPPLAPTVSSFKPRAQWTYSESSIFLYVNLPGFYRDQIKIKMDVTTRVIQIQGERPLSTQTKARFNETYLAPERCDLTKMNTSFSHGLLTIEFPFVVEAEKPEKAVQDRRTAAQSRGPGLNASNLGRKKPSDEEKQVGTSRAAPKLKEEEPKTYKSVLEDKRTDPEGIREKFQQKIKEVEARTSLGGRERAKEDKVVEQAARLGQEQTVRKLKEEEARSAPTLGGLKPKVRAKEEKVTEIKKDADIGQKVKEEGLLGPKVHAKVEKVAEGKGDGQKGQKLKEEVDTKVGQKKQEKYTTPAGGDDARKTEKNIAAMDRAEAELKTKEMFERVALDVNRNVKSKKVRDKISEGEIQETMKRRKIEEAGLAKETGDVEDNLEMAERKKVVSDDPKKEESTRGGEDRVKSVESEANLARETKDVKDNPEEAEPKKVASDDPMKEESTRGKMVEKSLESETGLLLAEGQNKTDEDSSVVRGRGEEVSKKYDTSLVNVGVAALVIMGFGAYAFVPILVKLFY